MAWLVLFSALGCQPASHAPSEAKLPVAVSILPHRWLVEQIGGDHVEVMAVVQPGESAETFQPSDAQVSQLARAVVFFTTGMPFERGQSLAALRAQGRLRVVDLRDGIALRAMHDHRHEAPGTPPDANRADHSPDEPSQPGHASSHPDGKDPHIWLCPPLLKIQARTIARTLAELDPPRRAVYDAHCKALEQRLDQADREIRQLVAPVQGKRFFVFHPAWGYFADEYGLKQVAIEAEGQQPSDKELTALQRLARQEKIRVVFVQPQIAGRGAEAVAAAVGARLETLDPLAPDLLDNLLRAARQIAHSCR